MGFNELVTAAAKEAGITKRAARKVLDRLVETIVGQMETGFRVPGLGKFEQKHRAARIGRNPQTGESVPIPARDVLSFRPSPTLGKRRPRRKRVQP